MSQTEEAAQPQADRVGPYAWYVTAVLTLCYTLAFLDSRLPFILIESIKADLRISDTQIGLITGPAFSLTYALCVIPIARLSDRYARKHVIAIAIGVWSLFTAAGGLAHSFTTLLLSRTGVAIGEGGLTPAAHSLISDYFPERLRARVIAIYSCGIALGATLAMALGGAINDRYGWRAAMWSVGASGALVALLVALTLAEPKRGGWTASAEEKPAGGGSLRRLLSDPVVRNTIFGATALCVAQGSASAWAPAYAMRRFGLSSAEIGASLGAIVGLLSLAGTLFGGVAASMISRRNPQLTFRLLALGFLLSGLLQVAGLLMNSYGLFLPFAALATLLALFYPGPTFATIQSRVDSQSRSFASAVALFCINGIGIAGGAFFTGLLSDVLAPRFGADALRWSIAFIALMSVVAAGFYGAASRHLSATPKPMSQLS